MTAWRGVIAIALVAASSCTGGQRGTLPKGSDLGAEWAPLSFLVGDWEGTGDGATGPSTGRFSLAPELGGKVLVRRSVNEYRGGRHEDLMVVFRAQDGGLRASYFDGEGHMINYAVTATDNPKTVVFLSSETAGAPRFRLTYASSSDRTVKITFEIQPPGAAGFMPYVGGEMTRQGDGGSPHRS
jgi:hypothetical protein